MSDCQPLCRGQVEIEGLEHVHQDARAVATAVRAAQTERSVDKPPQLFEHGAPGQDATGRPGLVA
ncbi:MAG: hypothetical protein AAGC55_07300, partial [Myxococcota bacterium]